MQIGELFVRIRGDASPLSRSLRGASGDLSAFDKSVGKLQGSMRALRANWLAVSAAIGTVGFALNKTFQAADAFEASQRKLASTAKITGQNLGFLQTIAADANKEFGLGARMANEFAIEVTKLTGKAGQIEQTGAALEALLNLGAGRGFGAEQTLQAVQQAILGIDEGTDKLFGKNPSVIYAEFADKVGLVASKMTDQQKAMALLNAAMDDGGKLVGEYTKFLASNAGQTELNRIRTEQLAAGIGRSMSAVRAAVLPIWAAMIEEVREFVEEARGIPVHLGVIAAKARVVFGAISDAFGNSISGGGAGNSAEQAARQNLARVEAAARESFARIRNEMNLVQEIVGPTSPIVTGIQNIASATDNAASAAANLAANFRSAKIEADRLATSKGLMQLAGIPGVTPSVARPLPSGTMVGVGGAAATAGAGTSSGGALGGIGSAFAAQAASLAAQFGPLAIAAAALKPVFDGLRETLGPVLATLAEPLREIGSILGGVLVPVLAVLEEPLRAVGDLFRALAPSLSASAQLFTAYITPGLKILSGVLRVASTAVSYVIEGFGYLIKAIGDAAGGLSFGFFGKGLRKTGEDMIKSARDSRRALDTTTPAVADLGEAAAKATAQLVNYANVQHINALRFGIGAGMGTGSGVAGRPGGRPALNITIHNSLDGSDVLVEQLGKRIQRIASRGGTTRFQLAT